jgi:hypothetical protein
VETLRVRLPDFVPVDIRGRVAEPFAMLLVWQRVIRQFSQPGAEIAAFVEGASGDIMFKAAEVEWCRPVFVLNLPNLRSTREGLTDKPRACCWLGLV